MKFNLVQVFYKAQKAYEGTDRPAYRRAKSNLPLHRFKFGGIKTDTHVS